MRNTTSGGFDLSHSALSKKPTNIPNAAGVVYKRECAVVRALDIKAFQELVGDGGNLTIKINIWSLPDIDRGFGEGASPHNHPWHFRSMIISGKYTEVRYWLDEAGNLQSEEKSYVAGDVNEMPTNVFHLVVEVEPGTTTVMVCGTPTPGNEWGYLDLETKQYKKAELDPNFLDKLKKVNPHL